MFTYAARKIMWRVKPFLTLTMRYFLLSIAVLTFWSMNNNDDFYMLAGTYTSGESEGIYVCKFNPANGKVVKFDSIKTSNPSYLSVSPDGKFVYAVNEDGKE